MRESVLTNKYVINHVVITLNSLDCGQAEHETVTASLFFPTSCSEAYHLLSWKTLVSQGFVNFSQCAVAI